MDAAQALLGEEVRGRAAEGRQVARETHRNWLLRVLTPLANPWVAGVVALVAYLARAAVSRMGFGPTPTPYFNYLADAYLHGQLSLRLLPPWTMDLALYRGEYYLYWPPFPALVVMPLVALFGVGVSDIVYTVLFAALSVALVARLLALLDELGLARLDAPRRAILVATTAFGTVLLILAPIGGVWSTAQIVGWVCVLLASIGALALRGPGGYFLVGLALGCAAATRVGMLFNGVWLAYYLLHRDRHLPWRHRLVAAAWGLLPVVAAVGLLAWHNQARFGNPFEIGATYQDLGYYFREDHRRYGILSLHYLPTNLYYHFVAYTVLRSDQWMGGGLFWMTPVLLGAPYAVWRGRRAPLVWALAASCLLVYVPIGLNIGTGWITFGPRYLLDLMVPLLVLTALGVRRWRLDVLQVLMIVSCTTYALGSLLWRLYLP